MPSALPAESIADPTSRPGAPLFMYRAPSLVGMPRAGKTWILADRTYLRLSSFPASKLSSFFPTKFRAARDSAFITAQPASPLTDRLLGSCITSRRMRCNVARLVTPVYLLDCCHIIATTSSISVTATTA